MLCLNCNGELTADETISQQTQNYRLRKCKVCGFKFYTKETVCDESEAKPLFDEWIRERGRKARAKKKGIVYEPKFADGREKEIIPSKPTSPLF